MCYSNFTILKEVHPIMQLTIRAEGANANALSYLLAKNPYNPYERQQKGHTVRLFYNEFSDTVTEVTVFITPDPLELVRNDSASNDITHYINDREFAVSSIFTSLIRSALGTALNGQPKEEYVQWVNHPFAMTFEFGPVASSLSDVELHELFEPLGYQVTITRPALDYSFRIKEKSSARSIRLQGNETLQNGLRQLFVLIPVIDNYKHYFIDEREIEKLERYGEGWLDVHPKREFIYKQALRFKELYSQFEAPNEDKAVPAERAKRLNDLRYEQIIETVTALKPETIVDLGAGEGKLSVKLGYVKGVKEVLAAEPSQSAALKMKARFEKAEGPGFVYPEMIWSSLFYKDDRLRGKDVIVLCEVIEHIDEERLPGVMTTILSDYRPGALILTTPNQEYNSVYGLDASYRHPDHRFEWTRAEFQEWCEQRNKKGNYTLEFIGIGEEDAQYGHPTQMCVFKRKEEA